MTRRTLELDAKLYDYMLDVSLRESGTLQRLRRETSVLEDAQMQISPEQGQFMAVLARSIGARIALEVGTYTGYSALCVAAALPEDGRLITCDVDSVRPSVAQGFWEEAGVADRIEFRLGPAADTLDALLGEGVGGTVDLAFIDADKAGLGTYYERCLSLVRPGGLILVDNTLWSGKVADPTVMDRDTSSIRDFNAARTTDERVDLSLVPIGDGLTVLRRR